MQIQDGVRVYRANLANSYWHYTQQRPSRVARLGWHYRDRYNRDMRCHVREVIAREQPDIVVCNNLTGWSISAWDEITAAGLPIVQVLYDLYLLCPKDTMFNHSKSCQRQCGMCSVFRLRHAGASAQVATAIGVSRFVLERITAQGYFSGARQHVVHNCTPANPGQGSKPRQRRSEEHTSELQSLMRISYAVFCLKKTQNKPNTDRYPQHYSKRNK